MGCPVNPIEGIGDGQFCNKIAQLSHLEYHDFDLAVLLDTDTIFIADPRPHLDPNRIQAKIVDFANPSIDALNEIVRVAGLRPPSRQVCNDSGEAYMYPANRNGGFYSVPRRFVRTMEREWRRWTL